MEQGFTFHWEAGRNPIMTNPEGLVVELEVERNIPYLRAGNEYSQPRPARETKTVAIAPMVETPKKQDPPSENLCLAGEEADINEEYYVDSAELDAMLRSGENHPHASEAMPE
mgnify:CR=1 FL=1